MIGRIIQTVRSLWSSTTDTEPPKPKAESAVESASVGRRMRTWGTTVSGPNTLIEESVATVRARSQHAYRNDPIAVSCVDSLVSNMVGLGITPRWNTGDKTLDEEILRLWGISSKQLDFDGRLDIAGLQELVARTFILSGDALCHYQYLKPTKDLLVPFQVKIMEADQFYEDYTGLLSNGNNLLMGIEFNQRNQRVCYHLHKYHPGETGLSAYSNSYETIQVKTQDMLHVYKPLRPGQCRGWPKLASILTRLKSIDEYEDGALDAQKTSALFSAFITRPDGEAIDPGVFGESVTYDSEEFLGLEPASMTTLRPGENVSFANPPELSSAYAPWMRNQLLRVSSAFGITYEQLTNDLEGASWATIRASLLEFQRRCRMLQYNILIHQWLRPLASAWLDMAVLSRAIRIPRYLQNRQIITNTIWDPDGWEWVDPVKHAQANKINVRCGFTSRSRIIGQTGCNSEVIDQEVSNDNKRADDMKLIYDSDPRHGKGTDNNTVSNPANEEST